MTFQLFGIEFFDDIDAAGFWVGSIHDFFEFHRSLIMVYYSAGEGLHIDLLWMHIVGDGIV